VRAPAISRASRNFAAIQAWNAAGVYQQAIAMMGRQIDGGE
jgi:membrane-bound lytic murein transglycosylase B